MAASTPPSQQQRRIERYLIFRFAIILMALGLVAIYQMGIEPDQKEPSFQVLYTPLVVYIVIGLASLFGVSRWGTRTWFTAAQVGVDFTMGALLTGTTGGVASVFCPVLFVGLFSACNVVPLKGALFYASLATLFLAATTLGYALGTIPAPSFRLRWIFHEQQLPLIYTYLIATGIAFHIVAFLGTQLSTGLLRAQRLQTEIIENMGEGLVAIDNEGRVLQINNEARRFLGMDRDIDSFGARMDQLVDTATLSQLEPALSVDEQWRGELKVENPGEEPRLLEAKFSTVEDERGGRRYRVGLFTDLALQKEVEESERRFVQLQELYEMSLGIAHEIRNPLASIRGCIQEIGRMEKSNPASERLVQIVCQESDRLDRIIEEFMNYTRRSPQPTQPVDITKVLEETVILLENHPEAQDKTFELAPCAEALWVLGHRGRIEQALLNLSLNALHSIEPGIGRVRVSIQRKKFYSSDEGASNSKTMSPGIEVVIEDNGVGIPEEDVNRIFTPFFTRREGGCGLGLSIVSRIVHDHGGTIRVRSNPGEGTVFSIWLPSHVVAEGVDKEMVEEREGELEVVV